ncbi:HAD hydrolase-like protein [Streptomyces sp. NPDC059525]|uniref:HAD hydrolase-like protein n=1 Tax=Streptomyces sp. NPDC059525 TaxID=3346857 RepID=UPI003689A7F0
MSALAAVLFDMDGTLVDTEVLWWQTTEEVADRLGHRLGPADAPEVVGRAVADTAAHLVRVTGGADAEAVADELTGGGSSAGSRPARPSGPAPSGC